MKYIIVILFLFTFNLSFAQSTTQVDKNFTLSEFNNITCNIDVSDIKYSNSSRLLATLVVTADVDLHLLEFLVEKIEFKVVKDNLSNYHLEIKKLPKTILKGREISFDYKIKLVIPNKGLASK